MGILVLRRMRPTRVGLALLPAFRELGFLAAVYSIWRVARQLPLANEEGAIERARDIVRLQDAMGLPAEIGFQQFVLERDWLAWASNAYYALVHVPATIAFLIWLFVRQRHAFKRWRTAMVLVTAASLFIRFQRVAPPRFLPELGFVNLAEKNGLDVYGEVGTGVSDQFAAMPSIHIAWAAIVSFGIVAASTSPWRWVFLLHLPLTTYSVTVTGHHWWMDDIVAVLLLAGALAIDSALRRWFPWDKRYENAASPAAEAPVPVEPPSIQLG